MRKTKTMDQLELLRPPSDPTSPSAVASFTWFEDAPAPKEVLSGDCRGGQCPCDEPLSIVQKADRQCPLSDKIQWVNCYLKR